jgi:hypothetical protein
LLASSDYVITSKQKVRGIQYQQETDLRKQVFHDVENDWGYPLVMVAGIET